MFFGASGSIAGGQINAGGSPARAGTYCARWKIIASYCDIDGARKSSTSGFGSDISMWKRQTHFAFEEEKWSITPTGCGSWTMITS